MGWSCDECSTISDSIAAFMYLAGIAVLAGNHFMLISMLAEVKLELLKLYRGDRSFTDVVAVNENVKIQNCLKWGGMQVAATFAAFYAGAIVLSLVFVLLTAMAEVPGLG